MLADPLVARLGRALGVVDGPDRPEELAAGPDQDDPAVVAAEAAPPDPARPRPARRARRAGAAGSRGRGPAGCRARGPRPAAATPASWSTTSASRSRAAVWRSGGRRSPTARDALPGRQEPGEGGRIDRLDLLAQPGQRSAAEEAEDVGVDPVALGAARPELAAQDRAGGEQPLEGVLDDAGRQAPAAGRLRASGTGRGSGRSGRADPSRAPTAGPRNAAGTPVGGETPTPSR